MNLYVATSFKNIPEARAVMDALKAAGHRITHDWTYEALDPSWSPEQQDAYLQVCGAEDAAGVHKADALVLINHPELRDAMAEFGMALGQDKAVFVLYPGRRASVFFHRTTLCESLAELLPHLEEA